MKKRQKFLFVKFCLEYPLSLESEIRPIKYKNMSSLYYKPKLKNLLSVLRYRLPRFRDKGHNQRVAAFCHKLIDKLILICGPFRSKNKT